MSSRNISRKNIVISSLSAAVAMTVALMSVSTFAGSLSYSVHKNNTAQDPNSHSVIIKKSQHYFFTDWKFYAKLIGGEGFGSPGVAQSVAITHDVKGQVVSDGFSKTSGSQAKLFGGLSGGVQFRLNSKLLMQLGLGVYKTASSEVKGVRDPTQDPTMDKFNYQYNVSSTRLMLESSLQYAWIQQLYPFVDFGAGYSAVRSSSYIETAAPGKRTFANNTANSFSWQLGLGMGRMLTKKVKALVGYRFVHAGEASLGKSPSHIAGGSPSIGNLTGGSINENEVYAGVSIII